MNSCLLAGPSLTPIIMDVLIRFRWYQVALAADIEKAFLMVSVAAHERDCLRFLWFEDILADNLKMFIKRFTRAVFGVISSPFLLNGTLKSHIESYLSEDPEFVKKISASLYVDDLNSGASTVTEAFDLYMTSKSRMKDARFNLRKWISNSKQLMSQIEAQERVNMLSQMVDYSVPNIGPDDQTFAKYTVGTGQTKLSGQVDEQKTLGLIWNYANDSFVFDLVGYDNIPAELPLTKWSVLSVVARLFDPLSLLAQIIVRMKVLFQELCISKCGLESPLNDTSSQKFLDWIHELRKVSHIVLPRCYFQNLCGNVIARYPCGFCDANIIAFAACTYLVIVTDQGLHSSLVASKTHVAPIDQESVPRLELLSAVLLARLIVTVEEAFKPILQIDKRLCWSDSTTTSQWIKNEEREWKSFVQK